MPVGEEEPVVVVDSAWLDRYPKGLFRLRGSVLSFLSDLESQIRIKPHGEVEDTPVFRQLVTYILVLHNGKLLSYVRTHGPFSGMTSLGVTSHVREADAGEGSIVVRAANRRIHETLEDVNGSLYCTSVLHLDDSPILRSHFAIVFCWISSGGELAVSPSLGTYYIKDTRDIFEHSNGGMDPWSEATALRFSSVI